MTIATPKRDSMAAELLHHSPAMGLFNAQSNGTGIAAQDRTSDAHISAKHHSSNEEEESDGSLDQTEIGNEPGAKRQAQHDLFAAWLSKRTIKKTKQEVQLAVSQADEESLPIRALLQKQDFAITITDPREYQLELFERAKLENTIAVLDTGSGKTMISILLLKHTIDIELEDRFHGKRPRVSFFLADSVQLVFQQAAVLEKNIDQRIDRFVGEMGTDFYSKETWNKIFKDNMIIVCTPDILLQCLEHAFVTLEQVNLLVFDEAHHAKKNHSYARRAFSLLRAPASLMCYRLIKDFYVHCDKQQRPKLFGMTASPVDAKEDPVKAAKELEVMLHSRIATASDIALLRSTVSRPDEVVLTYDPCLRAHETPLCHELKHRFGELKALQKHFIIAEKAASQLGDWCADQIWRLATTEEEHLKLERKTEKTFLTDPENLPMSVLNTNLEKLKDIRGVVTRLSPGRPSLDANSISPKCRSLIAYLNQAYTAEKQLKCIIFVTERWTARLLREILIYLGPEQLRTDLLIGNRAGEAGDLKVSFRKQLGTLNKFRKGEVNCLIATSVAEEGLDIPDCNLVIRFDLYETLIQYIQSRGRARQLQSQYVHMLEAGNRAHLQKLSEIRRAEERTRTFCGALPADRLLQGNGFEPDFDSAVAKEKTHRRYIEPTTGATLTYGSSLIFLAHFVSSLPSNSEETLQPIYHVSIDRGKFVCEVVLPTIAPIHSATGRPSSRKAIARRSAAFEACLKLREKGYIDGNFVSTFKKILPQMRNARLALTAKHGQKYDMKIKPDAWAEGRGSSPQTLFATVLELEELEYPNATYQPLVLLTRRQMPEFPAFALNLRADQRSKLLCCTRDQPIVLPAYQLERLHIFTLRVFQDVFNKIFEADEGQMSYWLAPATPSWKHRGGEGVIDWALLEQVSFQPEMPWSKDTPAEAYLNRYLIDRWHGGQRYYSVAIEPNLRPSDPVPDGAVKHKYMDNILGYTVSLFLKSRQRATWEAEQPIIRAQQLLQRLNWLDEFTEEQENTNTRAWVCLEPLQISTLPVPFVSMVRMFPGIITRLESYLIALEAFSNFGLEVKPELALEAMTKDSDNTEEHRAEQIHLQRGMGKNYERLEFIGDAFMKMATSISLFAKHPDDNEFDYHVNRMLMICNKNLQDTAVENKLYEYIRSMGFSRRYWYPQGLKLVQGKGANKMESEKLSHHLGDKTVADVSEAMIGACWVSYHDVANFDMAVKAVTAFVRRDDHDVSSWAEYYALYEKPKYLLIEPSASHLDLAKQVERKHSYHFKYPRLLRSAFVHPSQPFVTEKIPCYQRLEFLGDALLDMACIDYLFHRYPDRDPQWLTEHKMAMVSNKFLAALAVKLEFHKHLRYAGTIIEKQNRDYVSELEDAQLQANGARDYWTNIKQAPKALSDIVESYVGAIFVDSAFNYQEVERFFQAHVRWFFEDMSIYDTFANNHPTTYLHNLLTLTFSCHDYRLMANEIEAVIPGGPPTSVAALLVHGEVVADGEASSTKNAKVKASANALKIMQGLTRDAYRAKYKCQCTGEEKAWVGRDGDGVGMVGTAI